MVQDSSLKRSSLKSVSVNHKYTVSSSQGSVSSSRILKQRCKVQAAKAGLAFLRQEAELQCEKALVSLLQNNINSELKILAKAKEAAMAESELFRVTLITKKLISMVFCLSVHLVLNTGRLVGSGLIRFPIIRDQ